jgi:conjugal transfer pilus assembly protein TraF
MNIKHLVNKALIGGLFLLFSFSAQAAVPETLAKTHHLLFFYSGDCSWCHKMAPVVQSFAKTHGFHVAASTADGQEIQGFAEHLPANPTFRYFNVMQYPMLYLINKRTGDGQLVAQGYADLSTLASDFAKLPQ